MNFERLSAYNSRPQMMARLTALGRNNQQLASHQMRISTGSRLNRAEDDVASTMISAKIRGTIRGQAQALANISDAKSLVNVAEGSLDSIMEILLSMKEKTVQVLNDAYANSDADPAPAPPPGNGNGNGGGGGNGNGNGNGGATTPTVTAERDAIQRELVALSDEMTQILGETLFNGNSLFSSSGTSFSFHTAATPGGAFAVTIDAISADLLGLSEDDLAVSSNPSASVVLGSIDNAIETVAGMVGKIGASQKRLTMKHENLTNVRLLNESTNSRIADADFAREQMEIVKLQIRQQGSLAFMAQANAHPESVTRLFG